MKTIATSILLITCLWLVSCDDNKETGVKSLAIMIIGSWEFVRGNRYANQHMQVPFNIWYNIFKDTSIAPNTAKDIDGFYFTDRLIKNELMFTDDGQIFMNVGFELSNAPGTSEFLPSNQFLPRYHIAFVSKGAYTVSDSRLTYVFRGFGRKD